jgi:hypothetical protein
LIEIAGGETVFPEFRTEQAAKDRIVSPERVTTPIRNDHRLVVRAASWQESDLATVGMRSTQFATRIFGSIPTFPKRP